MSHTVGTSPTIDDINDDASTTTVPLGELLDAHIAKAKEIEITEESENYESPATRSTPVRTKILDVPDGYTFDEEITREFMAYDTNKGLEGFIAILKEKAMNQMMKRDPKFATSPIFVDDKDYEFSVDPELITLVESDPFPWL